MAERGPDLGRQPDRTPREAEQLFSETFRRAAGEYRWMLDRGYPARQLVKLVGDRHRLSAESRSALFRGVLSTEESRRTRERTVPPAAAAGRHLLVDGHNVLFAVAHYLRGVSVYRATDGLVRDVGGTTRRFKNPELLHRAADAVMRTAAGLDAQLELLLDAPVDFSRDHAGYVRAALARRRIPGSCDLVESVDRELLRRVVRSGPEARPEASSEPTPEAEVLLSTGDAEVIRRCDCPLVDLAAATLEGVFEAEIPRLSGTNWARSGR